LSEKQSDHDDNELQDNEVRVVIPEEQFGILEWEDEGLPCICVLNSALKDFEHKNIFSWHLSVIIDFEDLIGNRMPSQEERNIVDPFCDQLNEDIKAGGNALFFMRETCNGSRQMVWRVYDPEIADAHLNYVLEYHRYPRQFDYHMTQDTDWEKATWYLNQITT